MREDKIKLAYIILTHKNPAQLTRLVKRLHTDNSLILIHIDKKVDANPFYQALDQTVSSGQDIRYIPRSKIYWGEWGMIQSTLNGLKMALAEQPAVDYIFLISSQDYPIKSQNAIQKFLGENFRKSFLSFATMPVRDWNWGPDGGMDRLTHYYIRMGKDRWAYPPQKTPPAGARYFLLKYAFRILLPLPRRQPAYLQPYAGATWWTLHRDAAQYILDFIELHPDYLKFHKYTEIVDETFYQTILCNGPSEITAGLVNNDLRYIDWSRKDESQGHPEILTIKDCELIACSDALFARKFEPQVDSSILDWIDQQLLSLN
jgi:hypothetical protein